MVSIHDETHRFLHFNLTHTGTDEDAHYIDLAKLLSQINRRTYRQGMTYDVANMTFHDSASSETFIKVCTLPRTWPLQLAWKIGFQQWMRQQRAALEATGLPDFGPWHDFKIYMNADHITDVDKAQFIDMEDNTVTAGEWVYSTYEIAQPGSTDPEEAKICLLGANAGSYPAINQVSLMSQLEKTLGRPAEDPVMPDAASTSVWALMSEAQPDAEVLKEVIGSLEDDNDLPPYSTTIVPGSGTPGAGRPSWPWVIREACIQGGAHHMTATGAFSAPCGFVLVETDHGSDDNTIGVTLELMPGDYKGVSARPMSGGGR